MARQIVPTRVYDKDYFSGSQAALYIGDIFVDEVVSFAYRINQQKTPIYGYASDLFDAVSKGPVLITGNFAINYKESAYLYLVLMRYQQFQRGVKDLVSLGALKNPRILTGVFKNLRKDERRIPSPFKSGEQKILRENIQQIIQGKSTQAQRFEFYQSLAGFASQVGEDLTFENMAEAFEDNVWGAPTENLDKLVTRTDDSFFNGFDAYFTFGDFNNPAANHTVERISGIHLTGREKAVNISGEPIIETYDFFARNSF